MLADLREAARESKPDIDDIVDEISEVHDGLQDLAKEIREQQHKPIVVVAEAPRSYSDSSSLRKRLQRLGLPRWLAWLIGAVVAVVTVVMTIVQACAPLAEHVNIHKAATHMEQKK